MDESLIYIIVSGYFVMLALGFLLGLQAFEQEWARTAGVLVIMAGLAALLGTIITLAIGYAENLDTTAAPQQVKPATATEPYGGCDEAYRYPKSEGYAWCRDNGYLD